MPQHQHQPTSHYPNTSEFLGICDRLGFCVVAETNVETHGFNFYPDCFA
ncbi:MAG: hypothetical protein IJW71_03485 [Clostridia bacterium]|nr:hypothetical protein [Clostridia bacterium]